LKEAKASSRFFEKKRRKKLLLCRAMGVGSATAHAPTYKSFCALFSKSAA
jgi:hypothetical protein